DQHGTNDIAEPIGENSSARHPALSALSHFGALVRHINDRSHRTDVITAKERAMHARMRNPVTIIPEALQPLLTLARTAEQRGIPSKTIGLVQLRASQVNGCSVCADMHSREMKDAGETDERLFTVAAWRDAPYFTDA